MKCQLVFIPEFVGDRFNWHLKIWPTKHNRKINESGERVGRAILHLRLDSTSVENTMIQPHELQTKPKTKSLSSAQLNEDGGKSDFGRVQARHGLLEAS